MTLNTNWKQRWNLSGHTAQEEGKIRTATQLQSAQNGPKTHLESKMQLQQQVTLLGQSLDDMNQTAFLLDDQASEVVKTENALSKRADDFAGAERES